MDLAHGAEAYVAAVGGRTASFPSGNGEPDSGKAARSGAASAVSSTQQRCRACHAAASMIVVRFLPT